MIRREESAGRKAWNVIMGTAEDTSEGAVYRLFLLLLMILGISLSGYFMYIKSQYIKPVKVIAQRQVAIADVKRLDDMVKNINAANAARLNSMEAAAAIASMARYPFVAERIIVPDTQGLITQQVVIIPPDVRVRATMLLEGRSVAVLDIEGEPKGKIFKVGDRFAERKGRISRISPERVTIVYEGKEFTFTP